MKHKVSRRKKRINIRAKINEMQFVTSTASASGVGWCPRCICLCLEAHWCLTAACGVTVVNGIAARSTGIVGFSATFVQGHRGCRLCNGGKGGWGGPGVEGASAAPEGCRVHGGCCSRQGVLSHGHLHN